MSRIAIRSGRALLHGKVGVCWELLRVNAKRLRMIRSAGRKLMQGKLRLGLCTWQAAVQEMNEKRCALKRAGGRWQHGAESRAMDLWKEYSRASMVAMKLGRLQTGQRSSALRLGLRSIREAAARQSGHARTLGAASEMFENKGRRVAWQLWKEEAAAHRMAVMLGADGGRGFARRATRGALHALAETA